ncbi:MULTISPECIES: SAM-dependent methyltransferase [Streptomyces]|uniref:SAM-dependent methyltransferase n=1 Tax=Streptomyces stelliscabiei TaxID=146820 RepID=A0A8I0P5Y9_9ACTN|nr:MULTISPECIES: methyltransferase domain-containing protein [Streptomyces]KND45673.1 methyltransferase type 11 [Streptomyces stelliscabiei]MBE1598137.1 SAM-dependent methyltransferase [Streptomyces stelliscabiei]MDX2521025.1 methyltransferase domain-containing protein [Streptomyces stelliscabiei]SOD76613.1 Methyltransferase domain-containing protein [Streptomyces sp. 1222.2]
MTTTALDALHRPDRYPRSSAYDPSWLLDLDMGPNPLWLLEDLVRDLELRPGTRVLDLGSGKGATSVFLAREFGVEVVAADWWIAAEEAAEVFDKAGVGDRVTAVRAEAHALPFEENSFDAVVSVDAFEYFGTADGYLPYLVRFLRPGGQLGVATPALTREVRDLGSVPPHIKAVVGWEAIAWHTAEWWRFQWAVTELVDVTSARLQEDGWRDWLLWARACAERDPQAGGADRAVVEMLEADQGEYLTFALVTATRTAEGAGSGA